MKKIKLVIYYTIISKLPHSRFMMLSNKIRTWYVCKVLKIMQADKNNYFEHNVYIADAENIHIGKHCHINENVFIQGATIGNYVMIAPNVSILSRSHIFDRTDIPMVEQGEVENKLPVIEDDVWIGRSVNIIPGVRIGKGSIIGSGAVVVKDVEPYSIVGGVPAKLIRKRI